MQLSRAAMWRWAIAIGTATLVPVCWANPVRADERRTFIGKTVDEWVGVLRDRTGQEHTRAVWALGCIGPEATAAVPELVAALRRGDTGVVDALAGIGPDAAPAVPLLAEELRKEDCLHAKAGSIGYYPFSGPKHALVRIGAASVPELVKLLETLDWDHRPCYAAEALGEIGPPARAAVPALIRALLLQQPKRELQDIQTQALRRQAVIALGRIGPGAAQATTALNRLFDRDDDEQFTVLIALNKIGVPPVAKLIGAFPREGVVDDLAYLGAEAKEAVPKLRLSLTADSPRVRFDAAQALASIDSSATEAIPVLIEALDHVADEAVDVREVPRVLARFGPRGKAAIPALLALLTPEGSDPDAIRALVQIDPEGRQCVPGLIGALKDVEPDIVFAATESLGFLGRRARAAIPALAAVIDRDLDEGSANCSPRVSAVNGLVRIDRESPLVIAALIAALKCQKDKTLGPDAEGFDDCCDCSVLEAAANALGSCGPRAKAAVPVMIEILRTRAKDDYPYTAYDAIAHALGQIGPDANAAIPILRQIAEEKGPNSWPAVIALYRLAPDGKELAEKRLQRSSDGWVRWMMTDDLEGRAMLLGAMGRTSLEADAIIRKELERLDDTIDGADIEGYDLFPEWIIERLGRFGVGGRLAVPRLNELRRHRNPWIRLWAGEALARVSLRPDLPQTKIVENVGGRLHAHPPLDAPRRSHPGPRPATCIPNQSNDPTQGSSAGGT